MTFKEYYKKTLVTSKSLWKICGMIFTTIVGIIAIFTDFDSTSIIQVIGRALFTYSLIGWIWFLAIISGFSQSRSIFNFFEKIPRELKQQYSLQLIVRPQNPKYNYLNLDIISTLKENPFQIDLVKGKKVGISIPVEIDQNSNLQKRINTIRKNYKRQNVELLGWKLRKSIEQKDWERLRVNDFNYILAELNEIAKREKII